MAPKGKALARGRGRGGLRRKLKQGGQGGSRDPLAALAGLPEAEKRKRLLALLQEDCAEDDEEGADEDDETWTLPSLSADGRTASAGDVLRFDYAQAEVHLGDAESLGHLIRTCKLVYALDGSSWLPCSAQPRCLAERLAAAIFAQHSRGADFDPARSGAEWWAQVRHGGHAEEGIQFHWDTDECAVERHGLNIHPHLATVTYLTDVGAPTLVLDCRNSRKFESLEDAYGPIRRGLLSKPKSGKHIVFDGQLLHGTVPRTGETGERVTFLVNVWLNHRPSNCKRLSDEMVSHLTSFDGTAAPAAIELSACEAPSTMNCSNDDELFETTFSRRGTRYSTLRARLPRSCETAVLQWDEGVAALRGAERPVSTSSTS